MAGLNHLEEKKCEHCEVTSCSFLLVKTGPSYPVTVIPMLLVDCVGV